MSDFVTLRSHLMGSLNDLVESAGLGTVGKCSVICELVSLFIDYKEEGTPLFLDLFLTNDLAGLTSLIPQSKHLQLGTCALDEQGVGKAVKKAAPLVRGCWKMYLSPNNSGLDFGLFRDSGHPLNVSLDVGLQLGGEGAKFIRVTKLTHDAVRVSLHDGNQTVVHFTNAKDGLTEVDRSLDSLAEMICSTLNERSGQSCKTYLISLLSRALRESHGLLVAVVNKNLPAFLKDCVKLQVPIDLGAEVDSVRRDSSTIPQLHALEELILGMFASDGIVVFDTKARGRRCSRFGDSIMYQRIYAPKHSLRQRRILSTPTKV